MLRPWHRRAAGPHATRPTSRSSPLPSAVLRVALAAVDFAISIDSFHFFSLIFMELFFFSSIFLHFIPFLIHFQLFSHVLSCHPAWPRRSFSLRRLSPACHGVETSRGTRPGARHASQHLSRSSSPARAGHRRKVFTTFF